MVLSTDELESLIEKKASAYLIQMQNNGDATHNRTEDIGAADGIVFTKEEKLKFTELQDFYGVVFFHFEEEDEALKGTILVETEEHYCHILFGDWEKVSMSLILNKKGKRFQVSEEGWVVKDMLTGLEWIQNVSPIPEMTSVEAIEYCKSIGEGWRIPTVEELTSLPNCFDNDSTSKSPETGLSFTHPFEGLRLSRYWVKQFGEVGHGSGFGHPTTYFFDKEKDKLVIFPVRGKMKNG